MLVGSASFAAYRYGMLYFAVSHGVDPSDISRLLENKARLNAALSDLTNLNGSDLARGFWVTYTDADGNSHVFRYDPDALARATLTEADIAALRDAIGGGSVSRIDVMHDVAEKDLPPTLQFHNALYASGRGGSTSLEMQSALQKKVDEKKATSDDLFKLSYIAELAGNYAQRDALNTLNCAQFQTRCKNTIKISLKGRVVDAHGGVQGATVTIVSRPDIASTVTDETGAYTLSIYVKEMEKVRIRAGKRNYSEGFTDSVILVQGGSVRRVNDIMLETPLTIVTIDGNKKSVTGEGNVFHPDGSVTIHTERSTYEIPAKSIVDANGVPYTAGPIEVYLYEFTKGNPPESLLQVDTFDQVIGYAGNLMKSFGMPYIQFFSQKDGKELDVISSNPMVLTYTIADMDALRNNSDHIYRPLTDADMALLVSSSQKGGYPVDRAFLIHNQLLAFPAFWVFDRKRGVWDNVGISVLNTDGTIRTVFYTVKDAQ